jgi:hypothetical protein
VKVPNVLQQDFKAKAPNKKWVTDITEFNAKGQKLYLSANMDFYNGEIIAYRSARRPVFDLVTETLKGALDQLHEKCGPIVHSDSKNIGTRPPLKALIAKRGPLGNIWYLYSYYPNGASRMERVLALNATSFLSFPELTTFPAMDTMLTSVARTLPSGPQRDAAQGASLLWRPPSGKYLPVGWQAGLIRLPRV